MLNFSRSILLILASSYEPPSSIIVGFDVQTYVVILDWTEVTRSFPSKNI